MAKFIKDDEAYQSAHRLLHKLVKELPNVRLEPKIHNVNYLPEETVYFLDKQYMHQFDRIKNIAVRDCKLINYGKPAVNIIFNSKHKYFVKKKISNTTIKPLLINQIKVMENNLGELEKEYIEKTEKENNLKKKKGLLKNYQELKAETGKRLQIIREAFANTESFDFAVSNYYKYYNYSFVSFKYLDIKSGMLVSENSHIVKNVIRDGRLFKRKINIIFIDSEAMKNHCPYQNKKVESFLNSFEFRFEYGVHDLFIKKIPDKPN